MIGTSQLINAFGAPVCFTDTTDIFKDRSGVALYGLDYDASDAGGASGKFGEAAIFNGTSSKISTPITSSNIGTSFTISCWVNVNAASDNYHVAIGNYTTSGGWYLGMNNSMKFEFYNKSGSSTSYYQSTATYQYGQWYHFCVVFTHNSDIKAFINGNEETFSASIPAGTNSNGIQIGVIGTYSSSTNTEFDGKIDQVRIYNTALTSSQVTQLHQENNSTVGTHLFGCIANYNLDGNAKESMGTTAYDGTETDITYRYDGTPTAVDFGVGGKSNYGARFNGSSSNIQVNQLSEFTNYNFTLSIWIKTTDTLAYIFSFRDPIYITLGTGIYSAGSNGMGIYDGSNQYLINNTAMQGINDGDWHHIVMTHDGTNLKGYIDGSIIDTVATGTTTQFSGGANYNRIGLRADGNTSSAYNGDIDQVRIFNRAISDGEVSQLYGNGAGEIACAHTATTTNINYPVANTMYYKLDNNAIDETGTSTATEQEMQYRFGKYGQAGLFSGISNGSEINTNYTTGDTTLTHSIWMNQSGIGHQGFNVVLGTYWDGTTPYHLGYYVWTNATTINWRVFYGGDGGSTSQYVQASGTITQNQWHHIVATWTDGTGAKLYIDGSLAQAVSSSQTRNKNGINVAIGGFGHNRSNNANFKGLLDTYRYFNSELSASQVTQLYNEKPETDTSNFKAVLYEGNGGSQYISNVGFQPDLTWIKSRTANAYPFNVLQDSVRGANKFVISESTLAEATNSTFGSFDANGFTLTTANVTWNGSGSDYVAWNWKAGGNAVPGTGSGVSNVSVSANTDAGFSIVKYTGGNSASDTVNHGLTDAEMIILKDLSDGTHNWRVWHKDLTANNWLYLNLTNAQASAATDGGIRNVDSNSFGFINGTTQGVQGVNNSSNNYIAYVWKSISGYSKIGTYTGNGTTSKTVSDPSFEPSFVMIKRTDSTSNWRIYDNRRGTNVELYANTNAADVSATGYINFNSNGFELTTSGGWLNEINGTYLYMAFK